MAREINEEVNYDWGANMETDKVNIQDPGTGKPIILRHFEFKYPPGRRQIPTTEQLLTPEYRKHLNNMLWGDDLELIQEPRVVFQKKGFIIFCTCQPRKGSLIPYEALETMRPIQETLQQDHARRQKNSK